MLIPWASVQHICRVRAYSAMPADSHYGAFDQEDLQQTALLAIVKQYTADEAGVHLPDDVSIGILRTIATRTIVDALRTSHTDSRQTPLRQPPSRLRDLTDHPLIAPTHIVDEWLSARTDLATLDTRDAAAIVAAAHGYSLTEIATAFRVSETRVGQILRRARAVLRKEAA